MRAPFIQFGPIGNQPVQMANIASFRYIVYDGPRSWIKFYTSGETVIVWGFDDRKEGLKVYQQLIEWYCK